MKKKCIVIFLIGCLNASAQKHLDNLSFKLGYSQAAQMAEPLGITNITYWRNNIHSAYFGIDFSSSFKKKWSYSIGLQFCEKGYKTKYKNINGSVSFDVRYQFTLNYIECPLIISYKIKRTKINIGVVSSFLMDNNFRFVQTEQTPYTYFSYKYSTSNPDRFKRFDIGLNLGFTKTINNNFDIEFNYQRHFIKPDKWMKYEINYQQTFLLGIKYYFLRNSTYYQEKKIIKIN